MLIVGLGNPGEEYKYTRHNSGYRVVDLLAKKLNIDINKEKFKGMFGECTYNGKKVMVLKPTTYMNLSGESVVEAVNFYKLPLEDVIVVYDDIDIEIGKIRIRPEGSSGTHNGMRNISDLLGSHDFPRIRVGIGKAPQGMDLANFVLSKFSIDEQSDIEKAIDMASEAVLEVIRSGIGKAMNIYN